MSAQWCFDSCLHCGLVVDSDAGYCSDRCEQQAAAVLPVLDRDDDSDDEYDDPWLRVSLWAQGVDPIPPPPPERAAYTSPSKRILTPQYSTACVTSHSTVARHTTSPPRPAQRTSPTATESLVASSTSAASSLGGFVRSWAPAAQRPQLPRLSTGHFTVFAKAHESASADSDVSPLWPPLSSASVAKSKPPTTPARHRRPASPNARPQTSACSVMISSSHRFFSPETHFRRLALTTQKAARPHARLYTLHVPEPISLSHSCIHPMHPLNTHSHP
ncbi:hypothetical protein MSAN_00712700 [Mycena sanguinolenta]|uniref:Uncharacterized protein n=1 Tax=Mycena sanguinolenta TaxID=230812 RepID=A0A8H6Z4X0_9AGAR|nr:hypothetical protein MSAN_00712700 [Mycena sanguinolenta]